MNTQLNAHTAVDSNFLPFVRLMADFVALVAEPSRLPDLRADLSVYGRSAMELTMMDAIAMHERNEEEPDDDFDIVAVYEEMIGEHAADAAYDRDEAVITE